MDKSKEDIPFRSEVDQVLVVDTCHRISAILKRIEKQKTKMQLSSEIEP